MRPDPSALPSALPVLRRFADQPEGRKLRFWPAALVLLAVALAICAIALSAYRSQSDALTRNELIGVRGVARLKAADIERWMDERRANARSLSHDRMTARALARWLDQGSPADSQRLRDAVFALRETYGFESVEFFDQAGLPLFDDGTPHADKTVQQALEEAKSTGDITFIDIHRDHASGNLHMGFFAPIFDDANSSSRLLAFALFRMRPEAFLYPYLQSWPLGYATAETLLVRRDGNDLLVLNELRRRPDSALSMRLQDGGLSLPATPDNAAAGNNASSNGDVGTLAATEPVSGTPWQLIITLHSDEALDGIRTLAIETGIFTVAVLLAAFVTVGFLWQRQRLRLALHETAYIHQLEAAEMRFEHLAHHDPLTDLPNRLVLQDRLEQAVVRSKRGARRGAVLFLDLDRFKNVNDSLGHPSGDELLRLVAQRIRSRLRDGDTLTRLGGDEFVVLLEDLAEPEDAARVARTLITQLSDPFFLSGTHEVFIGTTIGISLFPDDGDSADVLIQNADTALYQGKSAGRGIYRFFTADLTRAAMERLELDAGLRRALERNEFVLYYQPLVTMSEGRVRGVEALVRWQDPIKGLVSPDKFIPLAEDTGLILPLGEWVLRTACIQMKAWLDQGADLDTMAINLSPKQFRQPDLHERISAVLAETGLPGHCLELEITEGVLMERAREAEAKLHILRDLGVRIAIDDFGTGYSSLAYLKRFPIDKLKVDQSFVRDIPHDVADMEIATAIIGLAKNLGLEVLAEGVETEAQADFLRQRGCDTGQGYLFGRPQPAGEHAPGTLPVAAPKAVLVA